MPAAADLQFFQCATPPLTTATANVGGAKGSTQITNGSSGLVFFSEAAVGVLTGMTNVTQYSNIKGVQTGSGTLVNGGIYLANSLDDLTANGVISFVSTDSRDSSSYFIRVYSIAIATYTNGAGIVVLGQQEDVPLNGTSAVSGSKQVASATQMGTLGITSTTSGLQFLELRNTATGLIVTGGPFGIITVSSGAQTLGVIPIGCWSAVGICQFSLDGTLNTTSTIANPQTSPGGSFAKPRIASSATAIPATMHNNDYITIWPRIILPPTTIAVSGWQMDWRMPGSAAA